MSEHHDDVEVDLDRAFSDLLEDVGGRTSPPPASSVIQQARRRRTTTLAAAAAVVLIVGAAAVASGVGRPTAMPDPTGPGQLPAPHVLDRDAWAAATAGWVDGWAVPGEGDSLDWVDRIGDPPCLEAMRENGPEPDRSGVLTLVSGEHAVTFGALADFDDPTAAATSWRQLSGSVRGCAEATLLTQATWDGAQAESYRLEGKPDGDYLWIVREGQALSLVWVAGASAAMPAATDTDVMTAIVAGLQDRDSFQDLESTSTGSATSSASAPAVPRPSVMEGDFAQALGSWDSGWQRAGDKVVDVSLPCLSVDSAPGSSGGFGSSVGTNGSYSVSFFADEASAAAAYADVLDALGSCTTPYDVGTTGSSPQVTVASSQAGVAWVVQHGTNVGVISIEGGHANPPADVSAAVGAVIDQALGTTTP
jgi:hypothetical protein